MLRQLCQVCFKRNDNTKRLLLVERLSAVCQLWLQGFRLIANDFCLTFFRLNFSVDGRLAVTDVESDNFFQTISLSNTFKILSSD
jgi:hypothetical protein